MERGKRKRGERFYSQFEFQEKYSLKSYFFKKKVTSGCEVTLEWGD